MELGGKFWLGLIGVCILGGIGVLLVFLIVGAAWEAWGALGALLFVFLVFGFVAWLIDRRDVKRYDDLSA